MISATPLSTTRVTPYNEILGVLMDLAKKNLSSNNFNEDIVIAKTGSEKDVNRAPLVVVGRGVVTDAAPSIGLGETIQSGVGFNTASTGHILSYAIIFESFGNSYAEAENIGNILLETFLATGQTVVSKLHPSISGVRLVSWSDSNLTEQTEKKYKNTLTINAFLIVGGIYNYN